LYAVGTQRSQVPGPAGRWFTRFLQERSSVACVPQRVTFPHPGDGLDPRPGCYCEGMLDLGAPTLLACPQCDLLQKHTHSAAKGRARCRRCGAVVAVPRQASIDRPLALALTCAQVFVLANVCPLVSMNVHGDTISTTMPRAVWALHQHQMTGLALLVFLTTLLAPGVQIATTLTLLVCLRLRRGQRHFAWLFRLVQAFRVWEMIDVLMLGILVSLVKLAALATVVPGVALWSFAALLVLLTLSSSSISTRNLWHWSKERYA
jgi:paraquat-inducible protein A